MNDFDYWTIDLLGPITCWQNITYGGSIAIARSKPLFNFHSKVLLEIIELLSTSDFVPLDLYYGTSLYHSWCSWETSLEMVAVLYSDANRKCSQYQLWICNLLHTYDQLIKTSRLPPFLFYKWPNISMLTFYLILRSKQRIFIFLRSYFKTRFIIVRIFPTTYIFLLQIYYYITH